MRSRRRIRRRQIAAWLALAGLAMNTTACGDHKEQASSPVHSRFYAKKDLRFGSFDDLPGIGVYNAATYQWSGLDVSVARYVMTALHIDYSLTDPHLHPVPVGDRDAHVLQGIDDLVIGAYSITDARVQEGITFTVPYLISYQDILIRTSDSQTIKTLADLRGKKVCTGPTSTTPYQHLVLLNKGYQGAPPLGAILDHRAENVECINRLLDHKDDAMITDSSILSGFQSEHKKELFLVGVKVWPRPEKYGIGFVAKSPADAAELNDIVHKMILDGAWRKALIENFCPAGSRPNAPPCHTAQVFIDDQPPTS